jgi:trk system potassium uptake protein TrkH
MRGLSGLSRAFPHAREQLRALGFLSLVIGGLLLTPLLYFLFEPAEAACAGAFLIPALPVAAAGAVLFAATRGKSRRGLSLQEAAVVVVAGWILAVVLCAYPFRILAGLNFTQGVFEAMSGWTTTGLSVVDVGAVPDCLLLWRSTMQLAGGAGLAIIMLAVFSLPVGAGLYRAEGRTDQLAPHVLASTRLVLLLYSTYALAGIAGLRLAGMSWFDAVNHSFGAVSTGGFSTRAQSIGHWNSAAIEAVTIPLMLLGNMNFLTAYLLVRGKLRPFLKNGEIKTGAVLLAAGIVLLFTIGTGSLYPSMDKRLRVAVFETVSALTTTGYSTVGYTEWPASGFLMLVALMLVGGGTCSTAGGIKKLRVYLLFKSVLWEIRRTLLPGRVVVENSFYQGEDRQFVSDRLMSTVGSFLFLYLGTWIAGALVISCFGYPLRDALFEYASSVGTVGLSIGITAAGAHPVILWVETAGMFLGRLEFFVIFVAFGSLVGKLRRR